MIRLTRRQWLALGLETKTRLAGGKPAVIFNVKGELQPVEVQWVQRLEDSQLKEAIDTTANGQ